MSEEIKQQNQDQENNINELNLSKEEILSIMEKIEIEGKYLDMIYRRGITVTGDENWLRNVAFCEESNKKTSDLLFEFSKNINGIFSAFDHYDKQESLPMIKNSILQFNLIFESINIALISNIYRELYRNANEIGPKNEEFLNIVKENLEKIKETVKEEGGEIEDIKIDKELFEKYNDNTIFFFIIKPLLLNFKEGALINLKYTIQSHEERVKELSDFVESNDKFYNFLCINKNQNLSDRIVLVNASKTFNDLHYLKFDEELIKGLFALNPAISEVYNTLITQSIIEELNIEFLLRDIVDIKELKKLIVQVFSIEIELSQKYKFPDILYSKEYLIMTNPKTQEIISMSKLHVIAEFLALNEMNFDKTLEDLKVVIEFTIKRTIDEIEKMQKEQENQKNKDI